jgi:hypothetical protein
MSKCLEDNLLLKKSFNFQNISEKKNTSDTVKPVLTTTYLQQPA